jgi:glutamate-1-semialdehyde 2,1-aminomutase
MTHDPLFEAYKKSHLKSGTLHENAKRFFAGDGATAHIRIMKPYRPYMTRAKGSKQWDVDGNEYIDFTMGHGALLLGHGHPAIVRAIQEQAERGLHYASNHELEVQWAELITDLVTSAEKVEFFSSGLEANLMAVRLGRRITGRRKILRFVENFHGWGDEFTLPPYTSGTLQDDVTIIPFNLESVEQALATREYAVLMTEGGGAHMSGQIPIDFNFIRALPDLTKKYGTVWHLDEVVTGFRDHPGGYQAMVGVKPDSSTFGKIVAGGLAGGVLVGKGELMAAFSPDSPQEKQVKHSGTWNGNPLTCAAGVAALTLIKTGRPQKEANETARYFRNKSNRVFKEKGLDAWLYGRSITHLYLGPMETEPSDETLPPSSDIEKIPGDAATRERLCVHLLQRGVSTLMGRLFVLSTAHSEEDMDKTLSALVDSLEAMKKEGYLNFS